ncbi:MAG: hypothetical protein H6730_26595 [Deltaproteobacteria bacterium]|nr:hypothetical protein [Deltaproteobacteria bacterium]
MRRVLALSLTSVLAASACGGDAESGDALALRFTVSRGGEPLACADVSEISEVTLKLRDAQGRIVAGVPSTVDCAAGAVDVYAAPAGTYTLELAATGTLSGDPNAVLFKVSQPVTVPGTYDLVLQPQVAYLTLGWTFGDDELAPCGTEVDEIGVIVSTGAGQVGSFTGTFGCTATPVVIPQPFDLQEYVIQVEARSTEGFPLFNHTTSRILDRGQNTYTANLTPLGGQVFFDWAFAVLPGDAPIRMCDAASVQVGNLEVTIESLEGGASVSESVPCTATMRPYAFTKARFTQGRQLALVVAAEGEERFWAREEFTMPAGDRVGDRLTLTAVGTATVGFQVATASCTPTRLDGVTLTARRRGADAAEAHTVELGADETEATFTPLFYGTYDVEAVLQTDQGPLCPRTDVRSVSERAHAWAPIVF